MAARPDTRDMLAAVRGIGATCGSAIPPGVDFTHFDFHFLNLLSDGATITGVVDINPPPLAGDRAFDLATLVFYVYDHDELRRRILDRLFGLAGRQAARAYLAHMVLRQVEWSVRHYPAAPATRRHLRLARLVLGDIGEPGPSRYVLR
jgi:aminoglycoside phosphotransferase (APT) family kinase protein